MWFCVEISQAGHSCLVRFQQERYAPANGNRAGSEVSGREKRAGKQSGVTIEPHQCSGVAV
jgi:hypothetical protein